MKARVKALFRGLAVRNIRLYEVVRLYICPLRPFLPHEPDFAAFRLIPTQDGIFLDVGANDGLSALSFRVFNTTTPILSIEPNPHHVRSLERVKRRISGFSYRIIGASDSEKSLTLFTPIYKAIPLTNYASLDADTARKNLETYLHIHNIGKRVSFLETTVSVLPLDKLELDPDIIKIDVEGFEESVIGGLMRTLVRRKPSVMVERNPRSFRAVKTSLESVGYRALLYDERSDRFAAYQGEEVLNVFFLHPDRGGWPHDIFPG